MTGAEKCRYWEMLSDSDMETVRILLENARWMHVASVGYTAALRLMKGILVYCTGKEAPKSENLLFLMNRLPECKDFCASPEGKRFLREKDAYMERAIDLTFYHVNDYPFTYKKVLDRFIGEDTAKSVYSNLTELIGWLKSFAPAPEEKKAEPNTI